MSSALARSPSARAGDVAAGEDQGRRDRRRHVAFRHACVALPRCRRRCPLRPRARPSGSARLSAGRLDLPQARDDRRPEIHERCFGQLVRKSFRQGDAVRERRLDPDARRRSRRGLSSARRTIAAGLPPSPSTQKTTSSKHPFRRSQYSSLSRQMTVGSPSRGTIATLKSMYAVVKKPVSQVTDAGWKASSRSRSASRIRRWTRATRTRYSSTGNQGSRSGTSATSATVSGGKRMA